MRRTLATLLVGLLSLLVAACGDDQAPTELHGNQVDPPFTVSPIALEDTDGEPFSLVDDTDKRLTLVFFGYTNCPDICGLVMGNLASALQQLDEDDRDDVEVVFVTTDPERDTADVVRAYLDRWSPDFVGLRGSIADTEQVAASVAVGMGEKLPSGGYEVDAHTTTITGVDVAGEAPIYWNQTTSPGQLVDDITALLQED